MGTGIIQPSTSISIDGGVTYDSGRVRLDGGVGIANQRVTNPVRGIINAARQDPPEVFSLFVPGLITAKTIGVWKNTRASNKSLGLVMEANFLTAQTTADVANFYKLHAADGIGNAMDLPFAAVASHFSLNDGSGVQIARQWTSNSSPSGSGTTLAYGVYAAPTQQLTVTGMVATVALSNFQDSTNYGTRQLRASIMDANGNVLASATAASTGPTVQDVFWSFPLAVVLPAGQYVYLFVDCITEYTNIAGTAGNAASGSDPGLAVFTGRTFQSAPLSYHAANGNGGMTVTDSGSPLRSDIARLTLPQLAAAPGTGPNPYPGINVTNFGSQLGSIGLLGSGAGALFTGDVTLSIGTTGAPIGTAAGSDLNARILLGTQ